MKLKKKKIEPAPAPRMTAASRVKPPLMGVRLPPFSGDRTKCTKCGHDTAKTAHFASGRTCIHLGAGFRVTWGLERLHRTCDRCHFAWDEACVPAIPQVVHNTMVMPVVKP